MIERLPLSLVYTPEGSLRGIRYLEYTSTVVSTYNKPELTLADKKHGSLFNFKITDVKIRGVHIANMNTTGKLGLTMQNGSILSTKKLSFTIQQTLCNDMVYQLIPAEYKNGNALYENCLIFDCFGNPVTFSALEFDSLASQGRLGNFNLYNLGCSYSTQYFAPCMPCASAIASVIATMGNLFTSGGEFSIPVLCKMPDMDTCVFPSDLGNVSFNTTDVASKELLWFQGKNDYAMRISTPRMTYRKLIMPEIVKRFCEIKAEDIHDLTVPKKTGKLSVDLKNSSVSSHNICCAVTESALVSIYSTASNYSGCFRIENGNLEATFSFAPTSYTPEDRCILDFSTEKQQGGMFNLRLRTTSRVNTVIKLPKVTAAIIYITAPMHTSFAIYHDNIHSLGISVQGDPNQYTFDFKPMNNAPRLAGENITFFNWR